MLIVHFHEVVIDDRHVMHIQGVGIQETTEGLIMRVADSTTWVLLRRCPNLPHMEFNIIFGQSAESCIVLDLVVLQ